MPSELHSSVASVPEGLDQEDPAGAAAAGRERDDLRFITEATAWMTESLDVVNAADRLVHSVVPALADFCCVDLIDEPGSRARRVAALHREKDKADLLYQAVGLLDLHVGGKDAVSEVLTTGRPRLLPQLAERPVGDFGRDPAVVELYQQLAPCSAMLLPLTARDRVLGVLTLCTQRPDGQRYTERDMAFVADLANKAALAVDNARLYAREHQAAETLQFSLLPRRVPTVPGLAVATRYESARIGGRVGGDWYDVLELPDGATGLAVGDVVGHDLTAAASMGQLRAVLRSYSWEGLRAGAVLDRCDQLIQGLEMAAMATAVYARLEPGRDGQRRLVYSNAGHCPPLLRTADGNTRFLDRNLSPLLGAVAGVQRTESVEPCPPGTVLLFYTDGLIDIPGADADEREQRLRDLVATNGDAGVRELTESILAEMLSGHEHRDDVALLAVAV